MQQNWKIMEENKIVIYQTEDGQTQIDVRLENETVWLTQAQMVELFQTTKQNVSLHVSNVFKEGELEQEATVKEYLTVQKEGQRSVSRKVKYYNLDVIISVGYRVKSKRGTDFRIWARKVLKQYLIKGFAVNDRIPFGGEELYPSVEEKAAMLLYLVTKNHSFSDGNKRIAATLFLWFLNNNGILYRPDGSKRLADNTLVALTLMIAESRTEEKDVMVKVVVNLINHRN